jgi:5-oxoprolinase (ATP-hydrolysing)
VCLERFGLRRGSGGKGKWTGGDGVVREFRFFRKMKVSVLSERRVFTPYGLEGGKPGERGVNLVVKKGVVRNLGGKNEADVEELDKVVIMTPGGGGYGLQTKDIH